MKNVKMKNVIGLLLILLPFIALGWFIVHDSGWQAFFFTYGGTLLLCGLIALGVSLIDKDFK